MEASETSSSSIHVSEDVQVVRSVVLKQVLPQITEHFKANSSLCKLSYEFNIKPSWDKTAVEKSLFKYELSPGAVIKRIEWKGPGYGIITLASGPGHALTESAVNAVMMHLLFSTGSRYAAMGMFNGAARSNERSFVGDANSYFEYNAEGVREVWFITEVVSHQNSHYADEKIQDALNTTTLKAINRIDIGEVDDAQLGRKFTFRRRLFVKGTASNKNERGPVPVDLGPEYCVEDQATLEEAQSCEAWSRESAADRAREVELPLERLRKRRALLPKRFLQATNNEGDFQVDIGFVIVQSFAGLYEEHESREAGAKALEEEREEEDRRFEAGLPMATPKTQRQSEKRDATYSPGQEEVDSDGFQPSAAEKAKRHKEERHAARSVAGQGSTDASEGHDPGSQVDEPARGKGKGRRSEEGRRKVTSSCTYLSWTSRSRRAAS